MRAIQQDLRLTTMTVATIEALIVALKRLKKTRDARVSISPELHCASAAEGWSGE
jgi:hypothetical protein